MTFYDDDCNIMVRCDASHVFSRTPYSLPLIVMLHTDNKRFCCTFNFTVANLHATVKLARKYVVALHHDTKIPHLVLQCHMTGGRGHHFGSPFFFFTARGQPIRASI